jgi:hypothetical protein
MGSPARADDVEAPTRPATSPRRSARDHEREQREHGQGYLEREDILWHLGRDPEARRYFSPGELAVLAALVGIANRENGRCDGKLSYVAKLANVERRTVSRIIGGAGYRSTIAKTGKNPGRALPERAQPGQLQGLVEHVWYSIKAAASEFEGKREAKTGRCTNWLKFTTWGELLAWGKARAKAQPKGRRGAHFGVDRMEPSGAPSGVDRMEPSSGPLNTIHSEADPEPRVRVVVLADVDERTERAPTFQSGSRSTPFDPLRTSGSPEEVLLPSGSSRNKSSPPPGTSPARAGRASDDAPVGARVVAPSAPSPPSTPLTSPQNEPTDTSCATGPTRAIARSTPPQDAHVAPSPDVVPIPQSNERARALSAPERAPLSPEETARLERIARVFVREYGCETLRDGRPTFGSDARLTVEARYREAPLAERPARLELLEDAAYSAGTDVVRADGVRTPAAFVFARHVLERRAHEGRPVREARELEAKARAEARERSAPRTLEDLSRELVTSLGLQGSRGGGELLISVGPVAEAIAAKHREDNDRAVAAAAARAAVAMQVAQAAKGTPRELAAKRDLEAAIAELARVKGGPAALAPPLEDLGDRRRRALEDLEALRDFDDFDPEHE